MLLINICIYDYQLVNIKFKIHLTIILNLLNIYAEIPHR